MIHGTVEHWKLETIDNLGARQQRKFWDWDAVTEAFKHEREQSNIARAAVFAVQRRTHEEIPTWNYIKEADQHDRQSTRI